jgi:hypothetical protein
MKKVLLAGIGLGIGFISVAQNQKQILKPSISGASYPVKEHEALPDGNESPAARMSQPSSAIHTKKPSTVGTVIGSTWYDLQTNSSVARRIVNHANGTVSVVWTIATDASAYPSRGTGYNYYDGTSWFPLASVTSRLEGTLRTGWPSIQSINGGKNEVIMSHNGTAYTLMLGTNSAVGSHTPWAFGVSNATAPMPATNHGAIWNRLCIAGPGDSTIHVIANAPDSTIKLAGVKYPFVYSRSLNGGKTFPIVNSTLPRNDSTRDKTSGGDAYSMDAQGNTVAIIHGGLANDVALWKSSDNGTTFTKTLIDSIPFVRSMTGASATDTMHTNDGSMSVVLDANNKVHVAYAATRTLLTSTGVSFFPGTIDLVYWNEMNKTKVHVPINVSDLDVDGDGKYTIGDSVTSATKCRYRLGSILTMPSITTDASGNVFIVFSLPADADTTMDNSKQSFRDIWVVASSDNGATWGKLQNVTQTKGEEEAYASVAKLVDNYLHIAYMHDLEPGTAINNAKPDGPNDIMYLRVSTADILAGVAGVKNIVKNDLFSIGQNYPNPFSGSTQVDVNLQKTADMTIEILNTLGQVVSTQSHKSVTPGTHTFDLNANGLSSGIYFYTIRANGSALTRKMSVK